MIKVWKERWYIWHLISKTHVRDWVVVEELHPKNKEWFWKHGYTIVPRFSGGWRISWEDANYAV